MAIPVGKLALYTAAAGIYPAQTLPVSLDVGTDRRELLDDPLYLGHRAPRLRGPAYDAVVEAFVEAVRPGLPGAPSSNGRTSSSTTPFASWNAIGDRLPSFNDDIQGTAAVVLAGLLAARRERGGLTSDRFMFLGAGAAAIGIAALLRRELVAEGMDPRAAASAIVMLDSRGLVHTDRPGAAGRSAAVRGRSRLARSRPGSGRPSWRTRSPSPARPERRCSSARRHARAPSPRPSSEKSALHDPVPDRAAAVEPERLCRGAAGGHPRLDRGAGTRRYRRPEPRRQRPDGRPRRSVRRTTSSSSPGSGLGAIVAETREVTDDMFLVAAHELAGLVSADRLQDGALYPPIAGLRAVARAIAVAVVREARDSGRGRAYSDEEIEAAVDRAMWWPDYVPFEPGD